MTTKCKITFLSGDFYAHRIATGRFFQGFLVCCILGYIKCMYGNINLIIIVNCNTFKTR